MFVDGFTWGLPMEPLSWALEIWVQTAEPVLCLGSLLPSACPVSIACLPLHLNFLLSFSH